MYFKAKLGFILTLHTNDKLNLSLFSCNTNIFISERNIILDYCKQV